MVTWVSRIELGLVPPDPSHLSVRTSTLRGVCVHWTGGAAANPHSKWKELQAAATSGQNPNHTVYGDIEYNAGFTVDGEILVGRDNRYNGAHALSTDSVANHQLLGITLVGETMTPAALDALGAYVFVAFLLIKPTAASPFVLTTHGELSAHGGIVTECPGGELTKWVQSTRTALNARTL
jgi:N-acetylmuramoyl-L-alanine amidase